MRYSDFLSASFRRPDRRSGFGVIFSLGPFCSRCSGMVDHTRVDDGTIGADMRGLLESAGGERRRYSSIPTARYGGSFFFGLSVRIARLTSQQFNECPEPTIDLPRIHRG